MKSLVNQIRKLNISNSVIGWSLGFDAVQLKAYNQNPEEYPIMTGRLKSFLIARKLDKYNRVKLNFLPQNAHKSSQSHDHAIKSDNLWTKTQNALRRIFSRRKV